MGSPGSSAGKESTFNPGDLGWVPGSGRSPGGGVGYPLQYSRASLVAQMAKNLPAMWETQDTFPIPGKAWQPIPVFLPGKSPQTEGPSGLQSMGLQRVRHNCATKHSTAYPSIYTELIRAFSLRQGRHYTRRLTWRAPRGAPTRSTFSYLISHPSFSPNSYF